MQAQSPEGLTSDATTARILLDTTPPLLFSSYPADGAHVAQAVDLIEMTLVEQGTGIDMTATLVGAALTDSGGQPVSGTWEIDFNLVRFVPDVPLGDGVFTLVVNPTDTPLGNSTTVTVVFTVDLIAPVSLTLDPVSSPTRVTPQTLTGTKVPQTEILLNDEVVVPLGAATDWSYTVSLVEGTNSLTLRTRDAAGNRSPPVVATIVYDETAPLPVTTLSVNGAGDGTSAQLDWAATTRGFRAMSLDIVSMDRTVSSPRSIR